MVAMLLESYEFLFNNNVETERISTKGFLAKLPVSTGRVQLGRSKSRPGRQLL